jgi:tripartite-type tricarboxylate transporter receptor subunit TctC
LENNMREPVNVGAVLRRWIGSLAATGAMLMATAADAQTSVRLLVGFAPGGGTDTVARFLADKLKDELGVPVVVENRTGAGGQIAAQYLKAAPADGSVLFLTNDHTISILPQVIRNPGFDPVKDFTPVAGFASYVSVLTLSNQIPAKSFAEYIAWLRQNGGKGNVGIPAPASVPEFLVKALGQKHGLDMVGAPYRGAAPMLGDVIGGQIPAAVAAVNDVLEMHQAQRIRVVAVGGNDRYPLLPQVPTFKELGIAGFEEVPYYGIYAPANTPAAKVERLSQAMERVMAQPATRERMATLGLSAEYTTPQRLAARERAYAQAWGKLIAASGFKPQ